MSDKRGLVSTIGRRPLVAVQLVCATVLITYGVYIASPLYIVFPDTPFGQLLEMTWLRLTTALLFFIPGLLGVIGVLSRSLRFQSLASFGMFLAFLFTTIMRITMVGWRPLTWIFTAALAAVSAVIYIALSRGESGGE